MITDEQARAALTNWKNDMSHNAADMLAKWASQELAKREAEHELAKPIAPAWLKSVGFVERGLRFEMPVDRRMLLFYPASNAVWLDGHRQGVYESREELLALLAALRGEPSGNPGQSHVSRGQANNIGPSR